MVTHDDKLSRSKVYHEVDSSLGLTKRRHLGTDMSDHRSHQVKPNPEAATTVDPNAEAEPESRYGSSTLSHYVRSQHKELIRFPLRRRSEGVSGVNQHRQMRSQRFDCEREVVSAL